MSQCHLVHVYYNFYAFDVCFMDVFPFFGGEGSSLLFIALLLVFDESSKEGEGSSRVA